MYLGGKSLPGHPDGTLSMQEDKEDQDGDKTRRPEGKEESLINSRREPRHL